MPLGLVGASSLTGKRNGWSILPARTRVDNNGGRIKFAQRFHQDCRAGDIDFHVREGIG